MDDSLFPAGILAAGVGAVGCAYRCRRIVLYARGMVLCPQRIPLSSYGLAPAHQSGGCRSFHRNRLFSVLAQRNDNWAPVVVVFERAAGVLLKVENFAVHGRKHYAQFRIKNSRESHDCLLPPEVALRNY